MNKNFKKLPVLQFPLFSAREEKWGLTQEKWGVGLLPEPPGNLLLPEPSGKGSGS